MKEQNGYPSLERYIQIKKAGYFLFPIFKRLMLKSSEEAFAYLEEENAFQDPMERTIFRNTLLIPNDLYLIKNPELLLSSQKELAVNHQSTMKDILLKAAELRYYPLEELLEEKYFSKEEVSQDYSPEQYEKLKVPFQKQKDSIDFSNTPVLADNSQFPNGNISTIVPAEIISLKEEKLVVNKEPGIDTQFMEMLFPPKYSKVEERSEKRAKF